MKKIILLIVSIICLNLTNTLSTSEINFSKKNDTKSYTDIDYEKSTILNDSTMSNDSANNNNDNYNPNTKIPKQMPSIQNKEFTMNYL